MRKTSSFSLDASPPARVTLVFAITLACALGAWASACSLVIDTDKLRNGGNDSVDVDDGGDAGGDGAQDGASGDSLVGDSLDTSLASDSRVTGDSISAADGESGVDTSPADTPTSPVIAKIYLIGGIVESLQSKEVLVADFHDDGTLGSWSDGPTLPAACSTDGTTLVGNTVYVVGVDSNADTTKTVRFAKLDKGILGDWSLDGSFPAVKRGKLGVAGITGFVYGIGGTDADTVGVKDVLFAPLGTDGTPGTWIAATSLPAERFNFAMGQWKNHVWVIGGGDATGAVQSTVFHGLLDGTPTIAWSKVGADLTFGPLGTDAVVAADHIYLIGGYGPAFKTVWYSAIDATGALGTWTESSKSMKFEHAEQRSVSVADKWICTFGGSNAALAPTVDSECAPLSTSGVPGDWKAVTPLPKNHQWHTGFAVTL